LALIKNLKLAVESGTAFERGTGTVEIMVTAASSMEIWNEKVGKF